MKNLLDKIELFINRNLIHEKTFASIIFDFEEIDFTSILNKIQMGKDPYFYTTHNKEEIIFLGFDSVSQINISGESRLEETEKIISELEKDFICNWNEFNFSSVPLFLGGMKFSSNNSDNLWNDFADSNWFVPRFLFLKYKGKSFLVYNFFGNRLLENKIAGDFELLNTIVKKEKSDEKSFAKIKIISTEKEKNIWIENVKRTLQKIESGSVQKIVLSRQLDLQLESDINISGILKTLGKRYPRCYVFAFRKGNSVFFGASPEKLAKISNGWIEADALAGSIPRGKSEKEDEKLADNLLSSKKDLVEQQIVVSFIKDSFSKFCTEITFEDKPVIRKLPNIQHLWTPIKGKIKPQQSIFSILKELHPTPAICGVPWDKARNAIIAMEPHNRGLFTGMIGWFNFYNEGEFAVAIRSALLKEKSIHAFAGCGIVKGSDPEIEYAESELKLKPIISLFESIN